MELITLLVIVIENLFELIILSANTLAIIEKSHIAKYGKAELMPFYNTEE